MPSTGSSLLAGDRTTPASLMLGRSLLDRHQLVHTSPLGALASTTVSTTTSQATMISTSTTIAPALGGAMGATWARQEGLLAAATSGNQELLMQAASQDGQLSAATEGTILNSFEELGHWSQTDTRVTALIHALLASFSVILVSELGDKTFIITAIMAMKNSRSLVFLSSASALLIMTILSVGMGVAATVIPAVYTHYAAIVLFLCFGLKMLKESWDMAPNVEGDGESEFEEVKRSLEVDDESASASKPAAKPVALNPEAGRPPPPPAELQQADERAKSVAERARKWRAKLVETLHIAPIVIKVFTMVFVAEWGDRSQISTVILAAREDSAGVFIGSLSGHVFCTGLAVIGGRFVADMISVRTMTLLGGIIFLFFAVFAILTGPGMS